MSDQDPGVLARGVHRGFRGVEAVRGLDLSADYGEVTALVGPNGSGKTTLLLMLATLLTADSGELRVAGHDPVTEPGAVRDRIGWMPDSFGVYDQLTTREYLSFFTEAYRLPRGTAQQRVTELLELVHLTEFTDQPVHVLSRGQKKRLGLARALINQPSVLLLDEPASGLDPRSRIELRDLLRAQAREGVAVLVSSHILNELEEIADRVVFVDGGTAISEQRMRDLSTAHHCPTWHIRALDDKLADALDERGFTYRDVGSGIEVVLHSEQEAAELLGGLLEDGVRVVSFAPTGNDLESAYLAFTEARR